MVWAYTLVSPMTLVFKCYKFYTDLAEMAEFILKNNFFEFETKIIQQISGTAIGTKFAPPYASLFMDRIENDFLESETVKSWL